MSKDDLGDWLIDREDSIETETADNLLEREGYKLDIKTEEKEWYINEEISSGIIFYLKTKEYTVYYDNMMLPTATNKSINMKLHNIISKKLEEFGWI